MKYTIDATANIFKSYRLQIDNSWRYVTSGYAIEGTDLVLTKPSDTIQFQKEGVITLGGETLAANPRVMQLFGNHASVFPRLHRSERPRTPTFAELEVIIGAGDDSQFNRLILDLEGVFQFKDATDHSIHCPELAVYTESFCPGNGYVGPAAAADKRFMNDLYLGMLDSWRRHLQSGDLGVMTDDCPTNKKEELILSEIEALYVP